MPKSPDWKNAPSAMLKKREQAAKLYTRENRRCARIALAQIETQRKDSAAKLDIPYKPLRGKADFESPISDLLANIRHLCDMKGLDFWALDNNAHSHYTDEVVQARTGVTQ